MTVQLWFLNVFSKDGTPLLEWQLAIGNDAARAAFCKLEKRYGMLEAKVKANVFHFCIDGPSSFIEDIDPCEELVDLVYEAESA